MTELEIIDSWITAAHKRGMAQAMSHLWVARDIIEARFDVPRDRADKALAFVRGCKESPDRDALVAAIEDKIKGEK